jgi:hypothetical protein
MSSYILKFSDPTTSTTITVPGALGGSGKNNYDTSLEFVGQGYANYGIAYAQNFLKLLENFSGPYAPEQPIEGQLWYDTSDPERKILRVYNGSGNSGRWPSASGVFQQSNDPAIQYIGAVKEGDLWADTLNSQLKLRSGSSWAVVGPAIAAGTDKSGSEVVIIDSNDGRSYPVIKNWLSGKVIEIISYNSFIPAQVIEGFSAINVGTNLTSKFSARYNGLAEKASSLQLSSGILLSGNDILKNNVLSQVHTGTLIVNSSEGIYVKNSDYNQTVQVYSTTSGAFVNFSNSNKPFKIGIQDNVYLRMNPIYGNIGINTVTTQISPTLDVGGGARFTDTVSITTSSVLALSVTGGVSVGGNISISSGLSVTGTITGAGKLIVGSGSGSGIIIQPARHDYYDIGSTSTRFRHIHASAVGYSLGVGNTSTATTVFYGRLDGAATRLQSKRNFSITGQIIAPTVKFDGGDNVSFSATVHRSIIADQIDLTTATDTHTLMVLNTATTFTSVERISKKNFIADVMPTGAIIAYGSATAPPGFLRCNGGSFSSTTYPALYAVLGSTTVPNLSNLAVNAYYIIKT